MLIAGSLVIATTAGADETVPTARLPEAPSLPELPSLPSVPQPSTPSLPSTPSAPSLPSGSGGGSPSGSGPSLPSLPSVPGSRSAGGSGGPGGGGSSAGGSVAGGGSGTAGGGTQGGGASSAGGKGGSVGKARSAQRPRPLSRRTLRSEVRRFRGCLGRLPALERRVLILRTGVDGLLALSRGQVARRLGVSVGRVVRLERSGVRHLRKLGRGGCRGSASAGTGTFAVATGAAIPLATTTGHRLLLDKAFGDSGGDEDGGGGSGGGGGSAGDDGSKGGGPDDPPVGVKGATDESGVTAGVGDFAQASTSDPLYGQPYPMAAIALLGMLCVLAATVLVLRRRRGEFATGGGGPEAPARGGDIPQRPAPATWVHSAAPETVAAPSPSDTQADLEAQIDTDDSSYEATRPDAAEAQPPTPAVAPRTEETRASPVVPPPPAPPDRGSGIERLAHRRGGLLPRAASAVLRARERLKQRGPH
jgi:hypothetical protein